MSVTSGFFNSLNGDRLYNADQMSAIFDGIINDGVHANIGTAFAVSAKTKNIITVGIGRAWFNSTWLYNDALYPINTDVSEILLDRYDAVVIEIDRSESVRAGSIKYIKGTPSSSPQKPTLTNTTEVHQYPLAYIYRAAGSSKITQSNITNMVGTSSCPYITGILQVQNIDNIVAQWEDEWDQWTEETQNEFNTWFESVQDVLDGDTATAIAQHIASTSNPHKVTPEQIGAATSTHTHTPASIGAAASSHTHAASGVTAGTLGGKVLANATAVATVTDKQIRNIYAGTSDMTAGSTSLTTGDIYLVYE